MKTVSGESCDGLFIFCLLIFIVRNIPRVNSLIFNDIFFLHEQILDQLE